MHSKYIILYIRPHTAPSLVAELHPSEKLIIRSVAFFLSRTQWPTVVLSIMYNNNLRRTADTVVIDRLMVGGGVPPKPNRQTRVTCDGGGARETRSLRASAWIYYYVCLRREPLPVAGIGSSWPSFRSRGPHRRNIYKIYNIVVVVVFIV